MTEQSLAGQYPLWVGLDGGGTQCRATIYGPDGESIGRGKSGPANPVNGYEEAKQSIVMAVENAKKAANLVVPLSQFIVGAGLAGLHLSVMQDKVNSWQHPFAQWHPTTDLHAAVLGAHHEENGAVIIIGTGFSALGMVDGKSIPIGGFGFPINALFSGSWLGLELVKAVMLDNDGVGPRTSMTSAVLAKETIEHLATRTNNGASNVFSEFAPLALEHANQGDQVAVELVSQGAGFIDRVIEKLVQNNATKIVLVGGVAPHIVSWLSESNRAYLCHPKSTPEFGAMMFARQQSRSISLIGNV